MPQIIGTLTTSSANNILATTNSIYDNESKKFQSEINISKQDKLISGENIATINGLSLLEGGDIEISSNGENEYISDFINGGVINIAETGTIEAIYNNLETGAIALCIIGDSNGSYPSSETRINVNSEYTISTNYFFSEDARGANVGDLLMITKQTYLLITRCALRIIPLNDAKVPTDSFAGTEGIVTIWDKQQINKISGIESTANNALPKSSQLPSKWTDNMNNALETGVYPWCTLGRPADSTGAYTCIVKRTSTDDGAYNTIEQTAYGREGELGKVYKRIIFEKNDGSDTQYGEWLEVTNSDSCYTKIELEGQDIINGCPQYISATLFPNNGTSVFEIIFRDYSDMIHIGWGTEVFEGENCRLLIYIADRKITYSWGGTGNYVLVSNESVISDSSITKGHLSDDVVDLLDMCNENVQYAGDAVGVQLTSDRKVNIIKPGKVVAMPYGGNINENGNVITSINNYVNKLNDIKIIVEPNLDIYDVDFSIEGGLDNMHNNTIVLCADGRLLDCRSYKYQESSQSVVYAPLEEQITPYGDNDIGGWFIWKNVKSKFLILFVGNSITFTPVLKENGDIYWHINEKNNIEISNTDSSTITIFTHNYYNENNEFITNDADGIEHVLDCGYIGPNSNVYSRGVTLINTDINATLKESGYKGVEIRLCDTTIDGENNTYNLIG